MQKLKNAISIPKIRIKQSLCLLLAAAFLLTFLGGSLSALAVSEIQPTCDEAYYATLDYYGALEEGSVVKSYLMNGATSVQDYGTYDEVVNLTDDTEPTVSDGSLTFDFDGGAPDRFYFEGKGSAPFYSLPWSIDISYRLNGVSAKAEDLAGKQGLVEINVDVLPRTTSSEYYRDNCVLQAAAVFNADDILSLEAPGAQVQLLGNLKTVLFMALPGEEQHFSIRVGSDDFSFDGMTFLIVPATLSQLDQIADVREAKEKAQDSYDTINSSLDVILNTLDGMDNSLNETADGLDRLDSARETVSEGKGGLYENADQSLSALTDLADALSPVSGHLQTASQALTDTTDLLTKLTDNAVSLKDELQNSRDAIANVQTDVGNLIDLLDDLDDYEFTLNLQTDALQGDLETLTDNVDNLSDSLTVMRQTLAAMSGLSFDTLDPFTVNGMSETEMETAIGQVNYLYSQYESYVAACTTAGSSPVDFQTFLVNAGVTDNPETAAGYVKLYEEQGEIQTINDQIDNVNGSITKVNALTSGILSPTSSLLYDLEQLTDSLGEDGMGGWLEQTYDILLDMRDDAEDYSDTPAALLKDINTLGDIASRVTENADTALDLIQSMDDTVNQYVPDAQQALTDAETATDSATAAINQTTDFLQALESLLKNSGTDLDAGTKDTLDGLSDSLRRSADGLGETDTIRSAKDAITKLIDDEWDSHTGEDNRVLLMDSSAEPVSLTSDQNQTPSSIQILLRSEEIKVSDQSDAAAASSENTTESGTFFSRVAHMFQDFWNAIKGLFTRS